MKIWIVVYNYGLCNENVDICKSFEEAKQAFKDYTGFEYDPEDKYKDSSNLQYSEFYEQCDIFKKEIE